MKNAYTPVPCTPAPKGAVNFETYQGEDGQWYWRCKASNGQVVATGAEGYAAKSKAVRGLNSVLNKLGTNKIKVNGVYVVRTDSMCS